MGILERLGNMTRSYLADDDSPVKSLFGNHNYSRTASGDPYLNAAEAELNDFLNDGTSSDWDARFEGLKPERPFNGANRKGGFQTSPGSGSRPGTPPPRPNTKLIPREYERDFNELGVPFGSSMEACKTAWKTLLRKCHPDYCAGDPAAMKAATDRSARANAAWTRISQWYKNNS
jgi:hypothetical protein